MFEIVSGRIEKAKKVVLYGPEGIGKSSLAGNFPNPVFIDTEGSTTEMEIDRLKRPTSWTMLLQQIDFVKGQVGRFKTLVIDTVDWAEMLCNQHVCSQHNVKGIEDFGYGKGYVYATEEFGRFLNKLTEVIEAGMNVVLTAHSQIVKFEQPDEMGAYDRYQLKLGRGTGSRTAALIKEWADMVLFLNYKTYSVATDQSGKKFKAQGGERVMYTTHHPAWDAKNRFGLPDELPLDYSHIAHIFNTQATEQVQETWTSQPTPEQQETFKVEAEPVQEPAQEPTQAETEPVSNTDESEPSGNTGQLQPSVNVEQSDEGVTLDPNIPESLRDLMEQHGVSEEEIQIVVSERGYYPIGTPILNYDPDFIDGVLVAAWDQVHQMIKDFRDKIPF